MLEEAKKGDFVYIQPYLDTEFDVEIYYTDDKELIRPTITRFESIVK